jgi:iron(III) transport system substrate-binding protein
MKTVKGLVVAATSAAALFAATTFAHASEITPQEQALVEAAKEEGSVTFLHPIFADSTSQALAKGFVERYGLGSDFKVNFLRKGTGQTVAQVRQEIQAGRFTVDMILVHSPGFYAAASERDAFEELDSGQWQFSEKTVAEAKQYSNYPYVVTPFAYIFQPVWNASCPGMADVNITKYADIVQESLKGKVIASDITKSFTYTNTAIAMSEAGLLDLDAYWPKLKALDPIVEFRTEPKMQMVITCQAPVDMWNITGRVVQNVAKDPSLKDKLKVGTYEEGLVLLGNQVGVLKGAEHPNAAKLMIEFLLSEEGANINAVEEGLYSFRENYTLPEAAQAYMADLSKEKLVGMDDWVAAQGKYEEVRGEWQEVFR